MNPLHTARLSLLAAGGLVSAVLAFPPAPHHVIHGLVRDEYGRPLSITSAEVVLETDQGPLLDCNIAPGIRPGENYRLAVPMDSLTAPDPYKETALRPALTFRLKVKIGNTRYVPIQTAGNLATLGQPAGSTLLNLTLGVDSDGDGLPDAWEQLLIQMLGGGLTLADIRPGGDNDRDGVTNLDEYLAGTYAWEAGETQGLTVAIVPRDGAGPVLEFQAAAGQTYSVMGTTNLVDWVPQTFRVPAGDTGVPGSQQYVSTASAIVQAEVLLPGGTPAMFFRVRSN
jgi:hypothetical protein